MDLTTASLISNEVPEGPVSMRRSKREDDIRDFELTTLRDVIVVLARKGRLTWTGLQKELVRAGVGTIRRGTAFSRGRLYNCVADLRCLGFIKPDADGYEPTRLGRRFSEVARYKAKRVSAAERQFFMAGLFLCAPTSRFLSYFTGGSRPRNAGYFSHHAMPLQVVCDRRNRVIFRRKSNQIFRLRGVAEVNRLRWGAFLLCRHVGLIDDLRVKHSNGAGYLWLLPIDPVAKLSPTEIRSEVKSYIRKHGGSDARAEVPELVLHISGKYKTPVEHTKQVLRKIITGSPAFYAERAPSDWVHGFEKSFIRISDAYRSAIYFTEQVGIRTQARTS
jgi:hypothetical protein